MGNETSPTVKPRQPFSYFSQITYTTCAHTCQTVILKFYTSFHKFHYERSENPSVETEEEEEEELLKLADSWWKKIFPFSQFGRNDTSEN